LIRWLPPTSTRLTSVVAVLFFALPFAAEAQGGKVPRIGVLFAAPVAPGAQLIGGLRQGVRELGYLDGQNVSLDIRFSDERSELQAHAAELVRLNVDVIVATGNTAIDAAQKATTSISIVMTSASDPVASGFVANLARPEGNITGLTLQSRDLGGKRLQLLTEAVPKHSRVAVLWDTDFPGDQQLITETEAAAAVLGVRLQLVGVSSAGGLDGAFASVTRNRASALVIAGSPMLFSNAARIANLAVKHLLPTMCGVREYVEAGCLMSYSTSFLDQLRRAAHFVDRVLKGAKPPDLPIEQPTKFYLAINLKTAKAIRLNIPRPLLERADQVIER
jgi:putative ABC transport system substrate-binding protein